MTNTVILADGSRVRLTSGEVNAIRKMIEMNGRSGIQWLPSGVKWVTRWNLYEKGVLVADPADPSWYRFAEGITLPGGIASVEKPELSWTEVLAIAEATGTLPPAKLRNKGHGLYSWSNGKDVLSPKSLSANVYRSSDEDNKRHPWVIRYFIGGNRFKESVHIQDGVWNLRMVRQILARVANAFDPQDGQSHYSVVRCLEDITRAAWRAAADVEIDFRYGQIVGDER